MDRDCWDDDEVKVIRAKQLAKVPYSKIANEHNTSRGAIAGLLSRRGYCQSTKAPSPKTPKKVKEAKPTPTRVTSFRRRKSYPPTPIKQSLFDDARRSTAAVSWQDLEPHHCQWQIQDQPRMFCGAPQDGKAAYCSHHRYIGTRHDVRYRYGQFR